MVLLIKDEWITEYLQTHDENVIVQCEVRRTDGTVRYYQCMACYLYEKQEEADCNWVGAEYCEEEDCYYIPAGWYEVTINDDGYRYIPIGDFVTAWQKLPEQYVRPLRRVSMTEKIKDFIDDAKENEYWSSLPIEEFQSIEELKETVELCYKLRLSTEIKAEHSNFYQGVLFSVANKNLPKCIVRMKP